MNHKTSATIAACRHGRRFWPLLLCGVVAIASGADAWWSPGDKRPMPAFVEYTNALGKLGIVNTGGEVATDGQPFFEALGSNGRACVSCHQPADGMSLSLPSIEAALAGNRWH